ncbi:MAG: flavin-containing monooxygenase [Microthrixaceae bacterium]
MIDRAGTWRAPPAGGGEPVAVIGGGAAGLAAAAELTRRGLSPLVLDSRPEPGGSWSQRYRSLRLNTVRWMSGLPGLPLDRHHAGRWPGRDQYSDYLRRYAEHHRLSFRGGVSVERARRTDRGWELATSDGTMNAAAVVVATGHSRIPTIPEWQGAGHFGGELLHSSGYEDPTEFAGRKVLIVGAGSSGAEIALDLLAGGVAEPLLWSVRTAPAVFPREVVGLPTTPLAAVGDRLPRPLIDSVAPVLEKVLYGPRDYLPEAPPLWELMERGKEPLVADGIVDAMRNGSIEVVAPVERLEADRVVFSDGGTAFVDAVISATGFRTGLGDLLDSLWLDDREWPRNTVVSLMGFVGFSIPLGGTLWAMTPDAALVADRLARELAAPGSASR